MHTYVYTHMYVVVCQKLPLDSAPRWHRVPQDPVQLQGGDHSFRSPGERRGLGGLPEESLGEGALLPGEVQRVCCLRKLLF